MNQRLSQLPRYLLLCVVASVGTASARASEVVTALAPLPDEPVFNLAPLRETIFETLADVLRFRREHPLTDSQTQAIRQIVYRHRVAILAQARSRLAAARMLRATIETPGVTEQQIREAAQITGVVIADGAVLRHALATEIQRELTPEQLGAWRDMIDRLEDRLVALLDHA